MLATAITLCNTGRNLWKYALMMKGNNTWGSNRDYVLIGSSRREMITCHKPGFVWGRDLYWRISQGGVVFGDYMSLWFVPLDYVLLVGHCL